MHIYVYIDHLSIYLAAYLSSPLCYFSIYICSLSISVSVSSVYLYLPFIYFYQPFMCSSSVWKSGLSYRLFPWLTQGGISITWWQKGGTVNYLFIGALQCVTFTDIPHELHHTGATAHEESALTHWRREILSQHMTVPPVRPGALCRCWMGSVEPAPSRVRLLVQTWCNSCLFYCYSNHKSTHTLPREAGATVALAGSLSGTLVNVRVSILPVTQPPGQYLDNGSVTLLLLYVMVHY